MVANFEPIVLQPIFHEILVMSIEELPELFTVFLDEGCGISPIGGVDLKGVRYDYISFHNQSTHLPSPADSTRRFIAPIRVNPHECILCTFMQVVFSAQVLLFVSVIVITCKLVA